MRTGKKQTLKFRNYSAYLVIPSKTRNLKHWNIDHEHKISPFGRNDIKNQALQKFTLNNYKIPILELKQSLKFTLKNPLMPVLEAFVIATILIGFFGILFKRNLLMKIIAMDVMSTGVVSYYVLVASRVGLFTPILSTAKNIDYADPVPQAVILTAIVIGFSILALLLVCVMKLSRDNPTLEVSEIEKSHTS